MNHWPTAPDPLPSLGADAHVWSVALDDASWNTESCQKSLSPDERARAQRFKFPRDRRRYVIAHAALRGILAQYVHAAPGDLHFAFGENGKPNLAPPFHTSAVEFNLSHSQERALLAVNRQHEIGVDIEHCRADFEIFQVARRFFTEAEVAALSVLPEGLRLQGFYKCWTSKEAFLKARGTGLSGPLDEVEISLAEGRVRIHAAVPGWALQELDCAEGYEAALVTKHPSPKLGLFRWHQFAAS